jgi:hypothetical protein
VGRALEGGDMGVGACFVALTAAVAGAAILLGVEGRARAGGDIGRAEGFCGTT